MRKTIKRNAHLIMNKEKLLSQLKIENYNENNENEKNKKKNIFFEFFLFIKNISL